MIGSTISHYKILEQLGPGGMGVVYKAEDTQLKRTVALKFLPLTLATDAEARERFIHEAQAASALDHPNICTIYDFGTTDGGQIFMVMPCYTGETLKSRIERGPLNLNDALDILVQIALGLSRAHRHGIVHRDIKPANIMITDQGEVKILDFGLAKLSGMSMMTRTGSTLGTVAYMSPEQARGEKVDQRTDLWSLGVVGYQMLTGDLPFASDYEQAVIYAILNEEAKGIRELHGDLPEDVEQIIRKLLAKNPADRYAMADDLLADVLAARTGETVPSTRVSQRGQKHRQTHLRTIIFSTLATLILLAIAVAVFVRLPGRGVNTNPNCTYRVVLSKQFRTLLASQPIIPGISSDGNWISFGAPNDSGRWDVYFSHVSWPQPRKIGEVANLDGGSCDISPDGDIVAVRAGNGSFPLLFLSTAGGKEKVVQDPIAMSGRWSPGGERYSFITNPESQRSGNSSRSEIWSVNKDGVDKRLEFADSLPVLALTWSPDARSMVFCRLVPSGKVLITRELFAFPALSV